MQHNSLHLCLPQLRFFVQRFLQRASSARVDKSIHFIIWSIFPHRHFTLVCLLHGGQGPSWHLALKIRNTILSIVRRVDGKRYAHLDIHADGLVDHMLMVSDKRPDITESGRYMMYVALETMSFCHKDTFSRPSATTDIRCIHRHDTHADIDDCHISTLCHTSYHMNNSAKHYLLLCTTTSSSRDHNGICAQFPSYSHRTVRRDIFARTDVHHNSILCRIARHTPNRLSDSIASFVHCDHSRICA